MVPRPPLGRGTAVFASRHPVEPLAARGESVVFCQARSIPLHVAAGRPGGHGMPCPYTCKEHRSRFCHGLLGHVQWTLKRTCGRQVLLPQARRGQFERSSRTAPLRSRLGFRSPLRGLLRGLGRPSATMFTDQLARDLQPGKPMSSARPSKRSLAERLSAGPVICAGRLSFRAGAARVLAGRRVRP